MKRSLPDILDHGRVNQIDNPKRKEIGDLFVIVIDVKTLQTWIHILVLSSAEIVLVVSYQMILRKLMIQRQVGTVIRCNRAIYYLLIY